MFLELIWTNAEPMKKVGKNGRLSKEWYVPYRPDTCTKNGQIRVNCRVRSQRDDPASYVRVESVDVADLVNVV